MLHVSQTACLQMSDIQNRMCEVIFEARHKSADCFMILHVQSLQDGLTVVKGHLVDLLVKYVNIDQTRKVKDAEPFEC